MHADFLTRSMATGAADSIVLYDPAESWSLANVVTMCGIHKALPMAVTSVTSSKGQIQGDASYDQAEWDTVIDVSGMWNDSYTATEWALDNLFAQCQDTDQLIAVQVSHITPEGVAFCLTHHRGHTLCTKLP